jgi:hypothetical protein
MNYQDAIRKINKLLGLYKFNSYKLADGSNELISESNLTVGEPIFIITENGQLPAPDGEFELEDTTKIKIEDGKVLEIKYDMEKKTQEFVDAVLSDGTIVKSPTFDVGEDVFVVSPDGKETPAPDGEHELKLKDSEGKEVTFKIITKDGKITERENVELASDEEKVIEEEMGMTPDLSEGNDIIDSEFKKTVMSVLGEIKEAIGGIVKDQEEMKAKVAKFSKEPAGQPINQPKNIGADLNASKSELFEQLRQLRVNSYKK